MKQRLPLLFLLLLFIGTHSIKAHPSPAKKVLVLQSGNSEFYWTAEQMKGLRTSFARPERSLFLLVTEYLDLIHHPSQSYMNALQKLILEKYSSRKSEIAGIIVCDDAALGFFIDHLSDTFKEIPLVFAGINGRVPLELETSGRKFAGLLERPSYKDTLDVAFQLHPHTKRVVVIGDSRRDAQIQVDKIKELSWQYPAQFIYRGKESFEELASFLNSLGPGDLIVRVGYYRDSRNRVMTFRESMAFLNKNTEVPIYSFWEGTLGKGIVGGKLLSGFRHGKDAGDLFFELIQSKPLQKPKISTGETLFLFDYIQLKKFQIPLHKLPPGSQVINRPYSFYETHKTLTWVVAACFTVLILLILILSLTNRKLRAARLDLISAKEKAEEANLTKSRFLANMSHEIRTPLGAVTGFSELLLSPDLTEEEKLDFSERIRRNGNILSNLVDDILDLSRVEAGRLQTEKIRVSLQELVHDTMASVQHLSDEKGLELHWSSSGRIPTYVTTDPVRFRQILGNIIGNAIKFTDKGRINIEFSLQSGKLRVDVKDTGRGLTDAQAAGLFEPFKQGDASTTRLYGGTGLGLSLSRGLARLLGGDVELVDYKPNGGCHFAVTVDAGDTEGGWNIEVQEPLKDVEFATPHAGTSPHSSDARILLAEDSLDNQLLVKRYLNEMGIQVDIVQNGSAAVEKALGHAYDLILMDIQMPVLDGIEATKKLRSANFVKPIIALTAHALKDQRSRSLEAGCNEHITKPIRKSAFEETIRKFLNT